MSIEILKMLVDSACSEGTISDQDKRLLFKKAKDFGIQQEVVEQMINKALAKQTDINPENGSGFITSDNIPPDNIKKPVDEIKNNNLNNLPPSKFTDITILEEQGAMSLVQKGKLHGRWIIIKRIKPEFKNNSKYKELFYKEFENTYHLDHPNVVRLLDKGEDSEGAYYTMEYVDGRTLTKMITTNGLNDDRLIKKIMQQILDGLTYVHKKQVFHRDLKPDNIMVTFRGDNVKLLDFGLAAADSFEDDLIKVGTPRYAAPEQMTNGNNVDQRADIYAIGLILLELLTGDITDKTASKITNPNYKQIIQGCLKQNPQDRFNDCQEIAELLNKPLPVIQNNTEAEILKAELANLKLRADNAFDVKDYSNAKNLYEQYLTKEPNNQEVRNRMTECIKLLQTPTPDVKKFPTIPVVAGVIILLLLITGFFFRDKIFNSLTGEDEFTKNLRIADSLFLVQEYSEAKNFYTLANTEKQDTQILEKIRIIDDIIENRDQADVWFDSKKIVKAIDSYNKVLELANEDRHSTERIKQCKDIISKAVLKQLKPSSESSTKKIGLENNEGYLIVDYLYDEVKAYPLFNYIALKNDGKWGYYIKSLKNFVPCENDSEGSYMQNCIKTTKSKKEQKYCMANYSE